MSQIAPMAEGTAGLNVAVSEVRLLRDYLAQVGYAHASERFAPASGRSFFPGFSGLQRALKEASPFHRLLLSVLRQGHAASASALRSSLPEKVMAALIETGLLGQDVRGELRTPDLALVPFRELLLVTELPDEYPTRRCRSRESRCRPELKRLAEAVSLDVAGHTVLDVSPGDGLVALTMAARGAAAVLALADGEPGDRAVTFNAVLNRLDNRLQVRAGSTPESRAGATAVDVVVGAFFGGAPLVWGGRTIPTPCSGGGCDRLDQALAHFERADQPMTAQLMLDGLGDGSSIFVNRSLSGWAQRRRVSMTAWVAEKWLLEEYVEQELRPRIAALLGPSAAEKAAVLDAWLAMVQGQGANSVYRELVQLDNARAETTVTQIPLYDGSRFDPRVVAIRRSLRKTEPSQTKEEEHASPG